jgi:hypothetical protein
VPPTPSKKDVALALLEKGSIFVHLDPRRDKVVVPKAFWVQSELVLQFGLQMRVPVPDLDIDDEGISGTLSFARRPFWCRVPWGAVFAIVGEDRRGAVWSQDAPPENKSITNEKAPEPKRSHLRAVPSPSEAPAPTIASEPASASACSFCSTPFAEDATSCAVCGAPRSDTAAESAEPEPEVAAPAVPPPSLKTAPPPAPADDPPSGDPPSDEPPPSPPPKRPHLRLVK